MKALQLTDYRHLEYVDVPVPTPADDEVLLQVKACAVCGSDIHGYVHNNGRRIPPIIMGHEAAGIITETGKNVKDFQIGEKVTFDSTQYCGTCENCRNGLTNLCLNRKIIGVSCPSYKKDGAMAEYITVKAHTLYRIPDSVPFEEACLIEPLSVCLHAVNISQLKASDHVVIIGDGTIGLMTLLAVHSICTENIRIIGKHKNKLNIAKKISPQISTLKFSDIDFEACLNADIIFDTVGTNETTNTAFKIVKTAGKIVLIGNGATEVTFPLQECIVRQIQVLGSYSSAGEYTQGLDLLKDSNISLKPFTDHIFPFSEAKEILQLLADKKLDLIKAILKF